MQCPYCSNNDTRVLESRVLEDAMRRRRECSTCQNRFTTYERALFNLTVMKKDGSLQQFDLQKVQRSIERALGKSDEQTLQFLARKVQQKILRRKKNPISSTLIGRAVLQELKKHDKIAYVRFASIYKEIDDPKLLEKELSHIS